MSEYRPQPNTVAGAYQVSKFIGNQAIVRNVTLEVAQSEIVLLTGESGSGKSTVMRMMAGIDQPTAGHVKLFHKNLAAMTRGQHTHLIADEVGVGFQAPNLDTNLSVWDNFIGLAEARGQSLDFGVAAQILSRLKLHERLDDKAAILSGGEKLKLALGRVMVTKPNLLLLDEPTYALDHDSKADMFEDISATCRELGTSALIVTHDLVPARAVADREYIMSSGQLVETLMHRLPGSGTGNSPAPQPLTV